MLTWEKACYLVHALYIYQSISEIITSAFADLPFTCSGLMSNTADCSEGSRGKKMNSFKTHKTKETSLSFTMSHMYKDFIGLYCSHISKAFHPKDTGKGNCLWLLNISEA